MGLPVVRSVCPSREYELGGVVITAFFLHDFIAYGKRRG